MREFLEKLKRKPEAARKRIFVTTMIMLSLVVFGLYLFSIKGSIAHSLSERASSAEQLPGEFRLPSLKDSVSASAKDIVNAIKNNNE